MGTVIRESIDLSEYPCEYARALPVENYLGKHGPLGGNTPWSPPPSDKTLDLIY